MRGKQSLQASMLSTLSPERRVRADHPLRAIKRVADAALAELSPLFDEMYAHEGRASIPPERLLKAKVLMALYSVRSHRLFCEQLDYNLLFRWFLDMGMDEESFDHSTFSKNQDRLLEREVGKIFLIEVVHQARLRDMVSNEHFTVDGTLIDAWASLKSFKKKDEPPSKPPDDPGNPTVDFHGEKRSNETHQSTTDGEARLARKGNGKEAKLSYCANALTENRNGLVVGFNVNHATGTAERDGAQDLLRTELVGNGPATVAGDKNYDTQGFVKNCRDMGVTPHVAQNLKRRGGSAIDGRTTRHDGYRISQVFRKRIEEVFGWAKTVGMFRKVRFKGRARVESEGCFVMATYNLLRIANLEAAAAA